MELWIRSQDREKLVKVNYVYILDRSNDFVIVGETIDSGPRIGEYSTKERALEVLDEIQVYLIDKNVIENCKGLMNIENDKSLNEVKQIINRVEEISVYQMPKE